MQESESLSSSSSKSPPQEPQSSDELAVIKTAIDNSSSDAKPQQEQNSSSSLEIPTDLNPVTSNEQNPNMDHYMISRLRESINDDSLDKIVEHQQNIRNTIITSTTALTQVNDLGAQKYEELVKKYAEHVKCVKEIKSDLEYIFNKLRVIKTKVSSKYPDAFAQIEKRVTVKNDEDED